jgi:predicted dehydrogenase
MIVVAVLGAGHWGPNLIRNFHNHQRSVVRWVVDPSAERLAEVRKRFPDVRTGSDPQHALADAVVDAVIVATPTSTHYALGRSALEHDKHVLIEKPIATSVDEGTELYALAATRQRVLMAGHVFVYNGGIRRVKQYLDAGDLGQVYYIAMVRTNLGPIRIDVNAAWDLAAHDVSIVNYWLNADPLSASAIGGTWINGGIEDAVFVTLRYPCGVLANLHVSWLNPRKAREITVVGERRMLTFDDMNLSEPLRIYDKHVTADRTAATYVDSFASFRASVRDGDITIPKVALGEPLQAECMHFLDCIASGAPPLTGGREGVGVIRALAAIERSLRHGGREEAVAVA